MPTQFSLGSPYCRTDVSKNKKPSKILEDCQIVIKQLQTQLENALQQIQQKDQIIKILTEQKEYYEQQSRKSDQKIYPKLKQQINFTQSLINGLKQHNRQLTEKNMIFEQQNNQLWQKVKEKEQILKITEQNITKISQQKRTLQKQWGQTLKCVRKKIYEIHQQNHAMGKGKLNQTDIIKKRGNQRSGQRRHPRKGSVNSSNRGPNEQRVEQIMNEIDQKLLNYEFIDMIQNRELRRNIKIHDTTEQNKQNMNVSNYNPIYQGSKGNKKIPVLKLSQLASKGHHADYTLGV